eukprot:15402174-Heterocapsa_arctica.AAC.1
MQLKAPLKLITRLKTCHKALRISVDSCLKYHATWSMQGVQRIDHGAMTTAPGLAGHECVPSGRSRAQSLSCLASPPRTRHSVGGSGSCSRGRCCPP